MVKICLKYFYLPVLYSRDLFWRDYQHILVWTSNPTPLQNNHGWKRNAAGFWLSHDFGFGLVNAFEAVKMAETFKSVPPMSACVIPIQFRYTFSIWHLAV